MTTFGKKLKNLRTAHGMTQKDLANKLHISQSTVCGYEKGYSVPTRSIILKISDWFRIPVNELITLDDYVSEREKWPYQIRAERELAEEQGVPFTEWFLPYVENRNEG